jgi:hypothetical protein
LVNWRPAGEPINGHEERRAGGVWGGKRRAASMVTGTRKTIAPIDCSIVGRFFLPCGLRTLCLAAQILAELPKDRHHMRKRTKSWRIATAYHEAGHAVVAHGVGLNVTEVKIIERLDGRWEGSTTALLIADPPQIEDQVAVIVAGMVTLPKFAMSSPVYTRDGDREQLIGLLSRLDDRERERIRAKGFERASTLIAKNRQAVVRVANFLDEHRVMDHVVAQQYLSDVCC